MEKYPTRKPNRLKGYDYSSNGAYFVTICAKDHKQLFGDIDVGDAPLRIPQVQLTKYGKYVDAQIKKIQDVYPGVSVSHYVIMPNHIHMIVEVNVGTRRGASRTKEIIPQIVQSLKSMTTKHFSSNIWHRSYHDHVIRNQKDFNRIAEYVQYNPARWKDDCFYPK